MKTVKNIVLVILCISLIVATALLIRNNSVNALAQDVSNLQSDTSTGLGDLNDDNSVDAIDASLIMMYTPKITSGTFEEDNQHGITRQELDIDGDGHVNSFDSHLVLVYSAHRGAGDLKEVTFEQYVEAYLDNRENELE